MPWVVQKKKGKFCVYKADDDGRPTGDVITCHDTKKKADAHVRALYANVEDANAETIAGPDALREYVTSELRGSFPDVATPDIDMEVLTAGDDDPVFITLPIARVGAKSSNGRINDDETVTELVRQVNENRPNGIMGHLKDDEIGSAFPEPDVLWLGAVREGDTAWAKGYLPPGRARTHIVRQKAKRGPIATSIYVLPPYRRVPVGDDGAWVLREFTLASLDLAPYERAALKMGDGKRWAVTAELEGATDNTNLEVEDMDDRNAIIAGLTVTDIPLIPETVREMIVNETGVSERLAEMEAQVEEAQTALAEMTERAEKAETALSEMAARVDELEAKAFGYALRELVDDIRVPQLREYVMLKIEASLAGARDLEKATEIRDAVLDSDSYKEMAQALMTQLGGPALAAGLKPDPDWREQIAEEGLKRAKAMFGMI